MSSNKDYILLARELPSFFSQIYHGLDFVEEILDKNKVDYFTKIVKLNINKKVLLCKELYTEKNSLNKNVSHKELIILDLLVGQINLNQITEVALYNVVMNKNQKKLTRKIGKLERLAAISQKEISYRKELLNLSKLKFEDSVKNVQENIEKAYEQDNYNKVALNKLKLIKILINMTVHNIKAYILGKLIEETQLYIDETSKLKSKFY